MFKTMAFLAAVLAGMALHAQELLPELAAPAAKHKAALEALDKQKAEAVALAAKSYVSALDSVEKSATAAGQIDRVAAVVKEREAALAGMLEPTLPAALPKAKLLMARKSLLAASERVGKDFVARKKLADADYLKALAALQPKAAANPELAKQVATEKAALLGGGGSGVGGRQTSKKANPKNVVFNGDFEKLVDGKPEGMWVTAGKAVTEENNTFVRMDEEAVNNGGRVDAHYVILQEIEFPKDAKIVTISARIRTKARVGSNRPSAMVIFRNIDAVQISNIVTDFQEGNGAWKTCQGKGAVPKEAVKAFVLIVNGRFPTQYDFDDIEVTFK